MHCQMIVMNQNASLDLWHWVTKSKFTSSRLWGLDPCFLYSIVTIDYLDLQEYWISGMKLSSLQQLGFLYISGLVIRYGIWLTLFAGCPLLLYFPIFPIPISLRSSYQHILWLKTIKSAQFGIQNLKMFSGVPPSNPFYKRAHIWDKKNSLV